MLIDIEKYRVFRNCYKVIKQGEYIIPIRFTDEQIKLYSKEEGTRLRSYCPAGVALDVITDSPYIKLRLPMEAV